MIFDTIIIICLIIQALALIGLSEKIESISTNSYNEGVGCGIKTVLNLLQIMGESFKESGKDDEADCDQ